MMTGMLQSSVPPGIRTRNVRGRYICPRYLQQYDMMKCIQQRIGGYVIDEPTAGRACHYSKQYLADVKYRKNTDGNKDPLWKRIYGL